MHQEVIMGGVGGQGIMVIGNLLAQAAFMENLNVTYLPIYGVEKRGGQADCTVVISSEEVTTPVVSQPNPLAKKGETVAAQKSDVKVEYAIGTMIEVPRGAVTADEIAKEAEFFSFGTNDLTQMGFGLSRDDAGKFLSHYVEVGVLDKDPFVTLDASGVGQLVQIAVEKGRKARPNIKLGICGEHGGDPASIQFFHNVGLTYVSCSPFRVPIARLAAAHAQLEKPVGD